jgi:predicted MPP superfamily phosphohydrolase
MVNQFSGNDRLESNMSRRAFFKLSAALMGAMVLSGAGAVYSTIIEPDNFKVNPLRLRLPRLEKPFNGFKLAQISDIHADDWMDLPRLERVVDLVIQQKPDAVAITGDFFTYNWRNKDYSAFRPALSTALSKLSVHQPTFAVLGNHDHHIGAAIIRNMLNNTGIHDISDKAISFTINQAQLHLCGIDFNQSGLYRFDNLVKQIPERGSAVLLCHVPDAADSSAATGRFDLQISGHSHGGQVVMPGFGPVYTPEWAHKYPIGQYQVGNMIQYTNRGLGMVGVHMRINCPPEISVFTLEND